MLTAVSPWVTEECQALAVCHRKKAPSGKRKTAEKNSKKRCEDETMERLAPQNGTLNRLGVSHLTANA
jgi:hypothetical protein